jgi:hypothetical protein
VIGGAARAYDFNGQPSYAVQRGDAGWFFASEACRVLEIANPRDAVSRLDDDERGVAIADTPGGPQEVNVVSESGLYALIFTSRKPEAKAFRRWVTSRFSRPFAKLADMIARKVRPNGMRMNGAASTSCCLARAASSSPCDRAARPT